MTHLERLFAALYLSDGWYMWFAERTDIPDGRKLYARCRAVVIFDRVLNNQAVMTNEHGKAFRTYLRSTDMNQVSWI